MKRFESDYLEGAHPDILRALIETNGDQTPGYGEDTYCEAARTLLRERCALPEGEVHFLVGGTQVNRTVIATILRPHQGVVAADTGHIAVHETGAIENSGHKVLTVPNADGKLAAAQVEELCRAHYADASFEHTVQPGMVYISNPSEFGTVYTKSELEALYAVCRKRRLPLFIDGARLGCALHSPACDYTLAEMAHLCDVFTIGGTKMGLLFGEAAVFRAGAGEGFSLLHQAERRYARQGAAARRTVSRRVQGRIVRPYRRRGGAARAASARRLPRPRLELSCRIPHQSAVPDPPGRAH